MELEQRRLVATWRQKVRVCIMEVPFGKKIVYCNGYDDDGFIARNRILIEII